MDLNLTVLDRYLHKIIDLTAEYGPKLLLALLVLFIGLRVIKWMTGMIHRVFDRQQVDPTLRPFLINLTNWLLKLMLFISVASMMGVETTSFVAVIGAASLAVGLALQGTLANFAGGVLILLFKPYKIGDLIEAQGYFGEVSEIQIFITTIITPEGKTAVIPNGAISNGSLTNFSTQGQLRVDLTIGIAYDADIRKAREVLMAVMENDPKVLQDPGPMVAVSELADSSVNLAVRPWSTPADYWDVYFGTLEKGKEALDAAGISIPFPQRDVHMIPSPGQS